MPRNSSGTYTLPPGNPVAPNTLIETNWANPTLGDVASAITDSLDRLGRGTMLAPLKIFDGTVFAPALSFNSEATTGIFRPVAGALGVAVGGFEVARFTAASLQLFGGLTVAGAIGLASLAPPVSIGTPAATVGNTTSLFVNNNAAPIAAAPPAGTLLHIVGANASSAILVADGLGSLGVVLGRRANGTLAAPTAPAANNALAAFGGSGYDGVTWSGATRAGMYAHAAEAFTPATMGADLRWHTTAIGTVTTAEKMRLTDAGNLGVGVAPDAVTRFDVMHPTQPAHARLRSGQTTGYASLFIGNDSATLGRCLSLLYTGTAYASASLLGGPLGEQGNVATLSAFPLVLGTNNTARVTIDGNSGALGVGVLPSPWNGANYKAIDINDRGLSLAGGVDSAVIAQGVYNDASWKYKGTTAYGVSRVDFFDGDLVYSSGPAGTGGAAVTFTERFRIDGPTGNVGIGAVPIPSAKLYVLGDITAERAAGIDGKIALTTTAKQNTVMGFNDSGVTNAYLVPTNFAYFGNLNGYSLAFTTGNTLGATLSGAGLFNLVSGAGSLRIGGAITRFESAELATPVGAVTTTAAHGGPRAPDVYYAVMRCKIAEHGWAVGQEVVPQTTGGSWNYQLSSNATNVVFQVTASGGAVVIYSATNALVTCTVANWRVVLRAIWL